MINGESTLHSSFSILHSSFPRSCAFCIVHFAFSGCELQHDVTRNLDRFDRLVGHSAYAHDRERTGGDFLAALCDFASVADRLAANLIDAKIHLELVLETQRTVVLER